MDYISLKEATRYCNYSQDYLKLRARHEKLKAVKISRNWITTKEWVREYLDRVKNSKGRSKKVHFNSSHPKTAFFGILMIVLALTGMAYGLVVLDLERVIPDRIIEIDK